MILTYQLDFLPHPNYGEILKSADLDLAPNPQNRILGLLHSKSAYRACAARSAPRGLQNY